MDYIIKDLVFIKKENLDLCTCYISNIKIHDVLNLDIIIVEHEADKSYAITFCSTNGRKIFNMHDNEDPCSCYSKYGFKSYKEAYDYANKEMKSLLNNFISSVLADVDDYIEEIGEI